MFGVGSSGNGRFYGESDAEVEAPLVLSLEHQYSMRAAMWGRT